MGKCLAKDRNDGKDKNGSLPAAAPAKGGGEEEEIMAERAAVRRKSHRTDSAPSRFM
jgi:hypothetical protein